MYLYNRCLLSLRCGLIIERFANPHRSVQRKKGNPTPHYTGVASESLVSKNSRSL
jgi:hypothetical protein